MEITTAEVPFRHWVCDDFFPRLNGEALELPGAADPVWVRYDNDCERHKRTSNDLAGLPPVWGSVFGRLFSPSVVSWLACLAEVTGLRADPTLHGGGVHVTDPGGWLQPHLDYALHPSGLERRLNLVLFLNPQWQTGWGGAFELYDDEGRRVVLRVFPSFNRAVIWEPSDTTFHGTQSLSKRAPPRVTAAVYYLADPRPGVTRKRALYVPRRA